MIDHKIFLHGVALSNYRGIGEDVAHIGPFQRFNFFIGPNNAGKSSILHFITKHLRQHLTVPIHQFSSSEPQLANEDIYLGKSASQVKMGFGVPISQARKKIEATLQAKGRNPQLYSSTLDYLASTLSKNGLLWLTREAGKRKLEPLLQHDIPTIANETKHLNWNALWAFLTNQSGGDLRRDWIPQCINALYASVQDSLPESHLIPAIREISERGRDFTGWDGTGLIEKLANLQNPGPFERHLRDQFDQINIFLRAVTNNPSATIEIPYSREHVLVHMDSKVLPLSSLGTGIHETVMLASFCTLLTDRIVCIEEPETHLHPVLQRRLIRYLQDKTSNQYFIATHSACLIDTPESAIFRVSAQEGQTRCIVASTNSEKFALCADLGYRASDILQSNCIIWVEGPSDRIYIRHWISALDPDIREGIHYSIMFYGGRLLSHLSASDPALVEADINALISVRRLNQHLAVVIDSDKDQPRKRLNSTKIRIRKEVQDHGGVAWITAGREIENYVSQALMKQALMRCHPDFSTQLATGQFCHVLPFKTASGKLRSEVDKVLVAKAVCSLPADLEVLDLREQISALVNRIRQANT